MYRNIYHSFHFGFHQTSSWAVLVFAVFDGAHTANSLLSFWGAANKRNGPACELGDVVLDRLDLFHHLVDVVAHLMNRRLMTCEARRREIQAWYPFVWGQQMFSHLVTHAWHCDRVQALPDHPPLLVLASSLQVEAVRGLEVGWQVVNLVELRVGVHGLVVLVGVLVHVVSGGEIGI